MNCGRSLAKYIESLREKTALLKSVPVSEETVAQKAPERNEVKAVFGDVPDRAPDQGLRL